MAVRRANSLSTRRDLVLVRPSRSTDNQRSDGVKQIGSRIASRPATAMWFLMAADLATVVWMYTVGSWLDHTSKFTATATLGGHHIILLVIAAVAFATLATLAVLTDGFSQVTPRLALAKNLACILSVVALTGFIALILAGLVSRVLFGQLRP
ncbi:hypothetical protein AB0L70_08790 [Kribbella sp. NPDC051952]|uniref:hypothetical protein n=1 Tax=Kribbella sp. NPDC051952 TaxID=3154851 RepID=UPI0034481527